MLKKAFLSALLAAFIAFPVWAAGPAQQWQLEITGTDEGVAEVAEIELRTSPGGESVLELFRNYTQDEPTASSTWTVNHNLGIQAIKSSVTIIAYAVDAVAPGDYFYNPNTGVLNVREVFAYVEVEFEEGPTSGLPASPEVGDIYRDTDLTVFLEYDGAAWNPLTVTSTTGAMPVPDAVTADAVNWIASAGLPSGGGAARNDVTEIEFPQAVVGAVTVRGPSFDMVSTNRPGVAVPVITGLENRPGAAAFDGNKGSWFKSRRAPTMRSPLQLQYTFWVGDPTRYPNIVEYAITAKKKETAPRSWKLKMYKDGRWVTVDQQAGMRFEEGETRVFSIN